MATLTPIDSILDEHTAALDPKTAEIIMELTDKAVKQKKLTAVMVTIICAMPWSTARALL